MPCKTKFFRHSQQRLSLLTILLVKNYFYRIFPSGKCFIASKAQSFFEEVYLGIKIGEIIGK